jgi:peptidoglycan hydrolase CwlO-like protein
MSKTSIVFMACIAVPVGGLILNRVDRAIGHIASANQQLITANAQLSTTNNQLLSMQHQLNLTNGQLLATNAKLAETQVQLTQTNTKLKIVDGVMDKFSFLRR